MLADSHTWSSIPTRLDLRPDTTTTRPDYDPTRPDLTPAHPNPTTMTITTTTRPERGEREGGGGGGGVLVVRDMVYVSLRQKHFPKGSRRCKTAELIQEFKQLPPSDGQLTMTT